MYIQLSGGGGGGGFITADSVAFYENLACAIQKMEGGGEVTFCFTGRGGPRPGLW